MYTFSEQKKREDKSSLAGETIQAPIQFQHIAKRVRSRIQSISGVCSIFESFGILKLLKGISGSLSKSKFAPES